MGLGCFGWRIWTHGDSTYIAGKGSPWKVSLHGEQAWRIAPTSEHVRDGREPVISGGRDTGWSFPPTEFQQGMRLAFAIGVTRNCLIPGQPSASEHVIEVPDRWDHLTLLYVWMTKPATTLDMPAIGGPLLLSNGNHVWVTQGTESLPACDPEPTPVGQMIVPQIPGADDVRAPGFWVQGVNLSSDTTTGLDGKG